MSHSTIPSISLCQSSQCQLGDENCPGLLESLDDRGVFIDNLLLERLSPPGCAVPLGRKQIFGTPGNAVKRAAVLSQRDLRVCPPRLPHGQVFSKRDNAFERLAVSLEPVQVHLSEFHRRYLTRANELGEFGDRREGKVFHIRRPRNTMGTGVAKRSLFRRQLSPREYGIERNGWWDTVGDAH
jgi:hypothetical protein